MASCCYLHILNTQWRQTAGVNGTSMATGALCPPARLGWFLRRLPAPTAFIGTDRKVEQLGFPPTFIGWRGAGRQPTLTLVR